MKKQTLYFIAFYKFQDCDLWNRSSLFTDKKKLEERMGKEKYIQKDSIEIREIVLPD